MNSLQVPLPAYPHFKDMLAAREKRAGPVVDIEPGHVSTAACIPANISMKLFYFGK
jgi:hypothetical protein